MEKNGPATMAASNLEVTADEGQLLVEGLRILKNCRRWGYKDNTPAEDAEYYEAVDRLIARLREELGVK